MKKLLKKRKKGKNKIVFLKIKRDTHQYWDEVNPKLGSKTFLLKI